MSLSTKHTFVNWKERSPSFIFGLQYNVQMIPSQFNVLIQNDTAQIFSTLSRVHFIILSHTQIVIKTFVINLGVSTFNLTESIIISIC